MCLFGRNDDDVSVDCIVATNERKEWQLLVMASADLEALTTASTALIDSRTDDLSSRTYHPTAMSRDTDIYSFLLREQCSAKVAQSSVGALTFISRRKSI